MHHLKGGTVFKWNLKGDAPPQRGRDGGDDLGDQPVEVGVGGAADLQVVLTKVIDCLQR